MRHCATLSLDYGRCANAVPKCATCELDVQPSLQDGIDATQREISILRREITLLEKMLAGGRAVGQ